MRALKRFLWDVLDLMLQLLQLCRVSVATNVALIQTGRFDRMQRQHGRFFQLALQVGFGMSLELKAGFVGFEAHMALVFAVLAVRH